MALDQPSASSLGIELLPAEAASRSAARPTNVTRTLLHVASGLLSVALVHLVTSRAWLIAIPGTVAVAAWSMEIARRQSGAINDRLMVFFKRIAHPGERYRVNSSTWYATALTLLAAFATPRAAEVGILVLAVGDPAAGVIGRSIGRIPLRANRSLEGTLGFVLVAGLLVVAWLLAFDHLTVATALIVAFTAAAAGALAELGSTELDDNFTIPLVSACAATAVGLVLPLA
jgi:dolichol kinase